jgi:hypothetical protein
MPSDEKVFHEALPGGKPIRDLGLSIAGSPLEPILAEFETELRRAGVRVRPRFYLSTEWGVPEGTVAVAIPFYLARPELVALHEARGGHVEGRGRADILRYLRHETGHVVNYAYRLYETEDWVKLFGGMTQPYLEEYRPEPFSPRFVRHLPGWYAQKHPDEDWSETFAVWMTPGVDWRAGYAGQPEALAKLEYCDQTMRRLSATDPPVMPDDLDLDVSEMTDTLDSYYGVPAGGHEPLPPGVEGALRAIFEDVGEAEVSPPEVPRRPASGLIRALESSLAAAVFRWTGYFPERTVPVLREMARVAERLGQVYPEDREAVVVAELTCLVTTLALNRLRDISYPRG